MGKGLVVVKPVMRGIVWGGASVCVGAVGALRVACVGACGGARQQGVAKLLREAPRQRARARMSQQGLNGHTADCIPPAHTRKGRLEIMVK